jgi:hypothetical protein
VLPLVVAAALLMAAACGGSSEDDDRLILTPSTSSYLPTTISSDLAVGPNRFLLGLLDEDGAPVAGAELHLRFFKIDGAEMELRTETDATPITVTRSFTHLHDDGTRHRHEVGELGVYVAHVEFDEPGRWGVEVTGTVAGQQIEPQTPVFEVRERSKAPGIGDPAPLSRQPTLADVDDIAEIDTSDVPNPDMHSMTIAEAVASGRPTVIAFATPAFCTSQICGPVKEIVDQLYEKYQQQANFVHVEPYFVDIARNGGGLCPIPIVNRDLAANPAVDACPKIPEDELPPPEESWNLDTEPWVFVVDSQGIIRAKFEAVVGLEELEEALQAVLG